MKNDEGWKNKLWFGDNLEVMRDRDNFPNDFDKCLVFTSLFQQRKNIFPEISGV